MKYCVYNAIQTPDGTILESKHNHDFKTHVDKNGETYMVDGFGYSTRQSINETPAKDLSVWADDSHDKIREVFKWGTRGKDGNQPLSFVTLRDMEESHISNILATQRLYGRVIKIFRDELAHRRSLLLFNESS